MPSDSDFIQNHLKHHGRLIDVNGEGHRGFGAVAEALKKIRPAGEFTPSKIQNLLQRCIKMLGAKFESGNILFRSKRGQVTSVWLKMNYNVFSFSKMQPKVFEEKVSSPRFELQRQHRRLLGRNQNIQHREIY